MEMIGTPKVLDALMRECAGEEAKDRTRIIIATPCGLGGAFQAGMLHALHNRGVGEQQVDVSLGLSAGSWNLGAFWAGQAAHTADVYVHVAGMSWALMRQWDFLGLEYLKKLHRGEVNPGFKLQEDVLREARHTFLVGVSDSKRRLRMHDVRRAEDIVDLFAASSAFPLFAFPQKVAGEWCSDPASAHPCPIPSVVRHARAGKRDIDVLILGGRMHPRYFSMWEQWTYQSLMITYAWLTWQHYALLDGLLSIDQRMERAYAMCEKVRINSRVRLLALLPSPEESVMPLGATPQAVRRSAEAGYRGIEALWGR